MFVFGLSYPCSRYFGIYAFHAIKQVSATKMPDAFTQQTKVD